MSTINKPTIPWQVLLLAAALVLVMTGCAPTYTDYAAFVREPRPTVAEKHYVLAPPDAIRIQSKRVREINGEIQRLSPDGSVNLPLLGRIDCAGKTVEQLSEEMAAKAQTYYEDADVTVSVSSFASKKIFVFGEVGAPGPYPYHGGNTVLATMALAQPTRLADPGKIQVLRPSADGDVRRRMTIDLNKMIKEGDTTLDAILEEGDILYVPANPLASVGLAFQQVLLPLQPIAQTVQSPADIATDTRREPYGGNNAATGY